MKVPLTISVEKEEMDILKDFCAKARVPVSLLFEGYISGVVQAVKIKGLHKKEKIGKLDFFRLMAGGKAAGL